MANKFHVTSAASVVVGGALMSRPVFSDIELSTAIGDGGEATSTWILGASVTNTSTSDPLADGNYAYAGGLNIVTFKVVSGVIDDFGEPQTIQTPVFNSCLAFYTGTTPSSYIYQRDISGIYYSSEFCFDGEKLNGVYNHYPNSQTYVNGELTVNERVCPYAIDVYNTCFEAATDTSLVTRYYTATEPLNTTSWPAEPVIFSDIALTTPVSDAEFYSLIDEHTKLLSVDAGEVVTYEDCYISTTDTVYTQFQDYFDAIGEALIYRLVSDTLVIGTAVYANPELTIPLASGFVFEGLHYEVTEGVISDIIDYNISPHGELYTNCSMITPFAGLLYYKNVGELLVNDVVYNSVAGLMPSEWNVAAYIAFSNGTFEYNTGGLGQILGINPCST